MANRKHICWHFWQTRYKYKSKKKCFSCYEKLAGPTWKYVLARENFPELMRSSNEH